MVSAQVPVPVRVLAQARVWVLVRVPALVRVLALAQVQVPVLDLVSAPAMESLYSPRLKKPPAT
jgi:hypothetical protein